MQLILLGIIAVIGLVVYFCKQKIEQKKEKGKNCPSCGAARGGICEDALSKITAERQAFSYDGRGYTIIFYFKCGKCGKEQKFVKNCTVEYKFNDDVIAEVRKIAYREWGIERIPYFKVEISHSLHSPFDDL